MFRDDVGNWFGIRQKSLVDLPKVFTPETFRVFPFHRTGPSNLPSIAEALVWTADAESVSPRCPQRNRAIGRAHMPVARVRSDFDVGYASVDAKTEISVTAIFIVHLLMGDKACVARHCTWHARRAARVGAREV